MATAIEEREENGSQAFKAQMRLRQMVLDGDLAPGARIAELTLVEKLGVSRTPIRTALMRLEHEGLLESLPNGGFTVKLFSERDVHDAIALRGTLEGVAVRMAAERGVSPAILAEARRCGVEIDEVLREAAPREDVFTSYEALNHNFHMLLGEMSGSKVIEQELERVSQRPFAAPSVFVLAQANSAKAHSLLLVAQYQHWQVIEAVEQREGSRAESLMREHSRLARHNLQEALRSPSAETMPSIRRIRRQA